LWQHSHRYVKRIGVVKIKDTIVLTLLFFRLGIGLPVFAILEKDFMGAEYIRYL
jgi:hypothetical protein